MTVLHVMWFDVRYYMTRISTWVYAGIFAALAFLLTIAIGGAFPGATVGVGGSDGNVVINSPYIITVLTTILSVFATMVTAAIAGHAGYRDFGFRSHPLFFTTPVSKWSYLGGRYLAAIVVCTFVQMGIGAGLLLGSWMPFVEQDWFGPTNLLHYIAPYPLIIVPNVIFTAAIFHGLASTTRRRLPHYLGGVGLVVGYILSGVLLADLDNEWLAAMLDPFGLRAMAEVMEYWTPAEKNTRMIGLDPMIVANRALWMSLGLSIAAVAWGVFRFREHAFEWSFRRKQVDDEPAVVQVDLALPKVSYRHDLVAHLARWLSLVRRAFKDIISNAYFAAILGAGVLFLLVGATQVGKMYNTTVWPVTYEVLELLGGQFFLFVLIIVTFYAGELVWHERDIQADQIVDTMPVPRWVPYSAKMVALVTIVTGLMTVVGVSGLVTQMVLGYTNFEVGLYGVWLFGLDLTDYALLCVFAMLVHVVVNHKYVGHVIVILFYGWAAFRGTFGWEHPIWEFASDPGRTYSDMNAHGPFLYGWLWFKVLWGSVAVLFATVSNLLWVQGQEGHPIERIRRVLARARGVALLPTALALVAVTGIASFVLYNTNILNEHRNSSDEEWATVRMEKEYKQYENVPQPRIQAVKVHGDIFPGEGRFATHGTYRIANENDAPVTQVHVTLPRQAIVDELTFSTGAEQTHFDEELGYRIFELAKPLQPGDEATLDFALRYEPRGFSSSAPQTGIVENGSFVNSGLMPHFGYNPDNELTVARTRAKYDLPDKERMADVDDLDARMNTYLGRDSDWIDFESTVCTRPDQIAIAPGYLQREWTEDGRRCFEYVMDAPILHFYSFLSARYEVRRDEWVPPGPPREVTPASALEDPENPDLVAAAEPVDEAEPMQPVTIEVYYHKGHEYNIDRMIDAVKKSLAYFSREFGPYQHRQLRILEFPRYATFAQSFPNTIPYSEGIGFIARVEEDDIDYPFYVTAHEVAHQWWAHQVIGGNVQGSTLLSETMSQYSALMVMEEEYGEDDIHKFLEYELDRYLIGRAIEREKEVPLARVENQPYIHYRKGAVVMYALKDYIGEEALNGALKEYVADKKFQEPPFTNTTEFIEYLREATPPELQYVIDDMFETITLYENKATEATVVEKDGKWEVTVHYEVAKFRADELGEQTEIEVADLIDIGVFDADEEPLYLEKHRIDSKVGTVTVTVDREPVEAGIDPYHKLIDRHSDDNRVAVTAG